MPASERPFRIIATHVLDGKGGSVRGRIVIEVADQRITRIIHDGASARDDIDVDLSGLTLLPGLVEAHGHHSFCHFLGPIQVQVDRPLSERAALAVPALEHRLLSGVVLMRNPGERDWLGMTMKQLVVKGLLRGPDLVEAGLALRSSAGHGIVATPVDGVDSIRKVIRENVKGGADFIKLFLSGAISTGTDPNRCFYSRTEVEAAVDEAHRLGKMVSAHVYGGRPLEWALDAGLDVVEHGFLISREQIEKMAKQNVKLVLTLGVIFNEDALKVCLPIEIIQKFTLLQRELRRVVQEACQAGLTMAFGTDDNCFPLRKPYSDQGASMSVVQEMSYAIERLGLTSMQVLQMATKNGAEVCDLGESYGTLDEGKFANVIGVRGDPLENVSALNEVAFVMKKGTVTKGPNTQS